MKNNSFHYFSNLRYIVSTWLSIVLIYMLFSVMLFLYFLYTLWIYMLFMFLLYCILYGFMWKWWFDVKSIWFFTRRLIVFILICTLQIFLIWFYIVSIWCIYCLYLALESWLWFHYIFQIASYLVYYIFIYDCYFFFCSIFFMEEIVIFQI